MFPIRKLPIWMRLSQGKPSLRYKFGFEPSGRKNHLYINRVSLDYVPPAWPPGPVHGSRRVTGTEAWVRGRCDNHKQVNPDSLVQCCQPSVNSIISGWNFLILIKIFNFNCSCIVKFFALADKFSRNEHYSGLVKGNTVWNIKLVLLTDFHRIRVIYTFPGALRRWNCFFI